MCVVDLYLELGLQAINWYWIGLEWRVIGLVWDTKYANLRDAPLDIQGTWEVEEGMVGLVFLRVLG